MIHVSIFVLSILVYFGMEDETFGVTLGCRLFEVHALLLIKYFFTIMRDLVFIFARFHQHACFLYPRAQLIGCVFQACARVCMLYTSPLSSVMSLLSPQVQRAVRQAVQPQRAPSSRSSSTTPSPPPLRL